MRISFATLFVMAATAAEAFSPLLYHTQHHHCCWRQSSPLYAEKATGITLKLAVDNQWGVAERADIANTSARFTSPTSLDMVHRLRRESDGVLVGRTTVETDNPSLTVRRVVVPDTPPFVQPVRIVLDTLLTLNTRDFAIFNDGLATLVYHAESVDEDEVNKYTTDQTTCIGVPLVEGRLSISAIVQDMLSRRNFNHVMVEGGPSVARSFLQNNLVDRVILVQAMEVTFQDPYPSGITEETFSKHGLECLGRVESGDGDVWQCWSRPGLPWPTENLENWP